MFGAERLHALLPHNRELTANWATSRKPATRLPKVPAGLAENLNCLGSAPRRNAPLNDKGRLDIRTPFAIFLIAFRFTRWRQPFKTRDLGDMAARFHCGALGPRFAFSKKGIFAVHHRGDILPRVSKSSGQGPFSLQVLRRFLGPWPIALRTQGCLPVHRQDGVSFQRGQKSHLYLRSLKESRSLHKANRPRPAA